MFKYGMIDRIGRNGEISNQERTIHRREERNLWREILEGRWPVGLWRLQQRYREEEDWRSRCGNTDLVNGSGGLQRVGEQAKVTERDAAESRSNRMLAAGKFSFHGTGCGVHRLCLNAGRTHRVHGLRGRGGPGPLDEPQASCKKKDQKKISVLPSFFHV